MIKKRARTRKSTHMLNGIPVPTYKDVPAAQDSRWDVWSAPLLTYLQQPKTLKQIKVWSTEMRITFTFSTHLIAYLELLHLIVQKQDQWVAV